MYISVVIYTIPGYTQIAETILCNVCYHDILSVYYFVDPTKTIFTWLFSLFWNYTSKNVESILHFHKSFTKEEGKPCTRY